MLRIAIFSDVHGNFAALRAVLAAIEAHRPLQLVVAAGDLVAPAGSRPVETFDLLVDRGCLLLIGNEDERLWAPQNEQIDSPFTELIRRQIPWVLEQLGPQRLERLQRLPRRVRISPAPGRDLLIVHASPSDFLHGYAADPGMTDEQLRDCYGGANARVIAFGHYHQPFAREWDEGLLVNVASVSLPKDGQPLAAYSILEWAGDDWSVEQYRVPYDTAAEQAALKASGIPL